MPDRWNFDLKLPVQPDPKLDEQMHRELQVIYNSIRLLADHVAGGNLLGWQSLNLEDLNMLGWANYTQREVNIRYLSQDTILVSFYISGVSNSGVASFDLPTASTQFLSTASGQAVDNSVALTSPGLILMSPDNNTVEIVKDSALTPWTASGTKTVSGQFIYKIGE